MYISYSDFAIHSLILNKKGTNLNNKVPFE